MTLLVVLVISRRPACLWLSVDSYQNIFDTVPSASEDEGPARSYHHRMSKMIGTLNGKHDCRN